TASSVDLAFGAFAITGGSLALQLAANGSYALRAEGTGSLTSTAAVTFTGTFAGEANTTGADATLLGHTVHAGVTRLAGNVTLAIPAATISLHGDFVVTKTGTELEIVATGVDVSVGT